MRGINGMYAGKKLLSVLMFLVMLGCAMPAMAMEIKGKPTSENVIKTKPGRVVLISQNAAEIVIHGEKYKILVKTANSRTGNSYAVEILDSRGKVIWKGISETNPIEYLKNGQYSVSDLPIPPDANINIYPDKYTYRTGDSGKVTIDVDNGGAIFGYTSYFVLIPEGVTYNGVLDGPEPTGVVQLTDDNNCFIVPEYGIVCGKGKLLIWQALHWPGYKKQVVLSVTYNNPGSFKFEAGTAVVDGIIGWGDASSDGFTVSVT